MGRWRINAIMTNLATLSEQQVPNCSNTGLPQGGILGRHCSNRQEGVPFLTNAASSYYPGYEAKNLGPRTVAGKPPMGRWI